MEIGHLLKQFCPSGKTISECAIQTTKGTRVADVAWCSSKRHEEVKHEYGINLTEDYTKAKYDAIVLAVAHKKFLDIDIENLRNGSKTVIYDIKGIWDKEKVDGRL